MNWTAATLQDIQIIRQYLYRPKKVLTGNILLVLLYLGCKTNRVFHLDISLICQFRVISVPLYVFWSLHS